MDLSLREGPASKPHHHPLGPGRLGRRPNLSRSKIMPRHDLFGTGIYDPCNQPPQWINMPVRMKSQAYFSGLDIDPNEAREGNLQKKL